MSAPDPSDDDDHTEFAFSAGYAAGWLSKPEHRARVVGWIKARQFNVERLKTLRNHLDSIIKQIEP